MVDLQEAEVDLEHFLHQRVVAVVTAQLGLRRERGVEITLLLEHKLKGKHYELTMNRMCYNELLG